MTSTVSTDCGISRRKYTSALASCSNADASFPSKLHGMLQFVEIMDLANVVSWLSHGRAFKIYNPYHFMTKVARLFFKATKMRSIHRQLCLWGFQRITSGVDKEAWFHESFLRGKPGLIKYMVRTKVKGEASLRPRPITPNFYQMPPIDADTQMSILEDELECTRREKPCLVMPPLQYSRVLVATALPTELNFGSSHQTNLARRDRCRSVSCDMTDADVPTINEMIEPLPSRGDNSKVPFDVDELSAFEPLPLGGGGGKVPFDVDEFSAFVRFLSSLID